MTETDGFTSDNPYTFKYPRKRRQRPQRLHRLHCYVARSGVAALSASASILSRQVQSIGSSLADVEDSGPLFLGSSSSQPLGSTSSHDSDWSIGNIMGGDSDHNVAMQQPTAHVSRLKAAVKAAASWVGDIANITVAEFQPPPRRGAAEEDADGDNEGAEAPVALFWAVNATVACGLSGIALFVFAFTASDATTPISISQYVVEARAAKEATSILYGNTRHDEIRLKGIATVCLSFVAGSALAQRNSLRSALLCGV